MRAENERLKNAREHGQDLATLTYGKEALAAVVRDRLSPNGIKKKRQHTVARGLSPAQSDECEGQALALR